MYSKFAIAIVLTLSCLQVFAQLEQPLRVEIDLENTNSDYNVIPVGENGLVMYTLSPDKVPQRTKVKWLFTGYNTEFKEKWKSGYIIDEPYFVKEHTYVNDFLYLLYLRNNRDEFVLTEVNVKTGEIRSLHGLLPKKFVMSTIAVHNNSAYINGFTRKGPALMHVDLNNKKVSEIELKFDGEAQFESADVSSDSNEVHLVYRIEDNRKKFLNIKTFQGLQLLDDLIINPEGNDHLLTGKINSINDREKIILGTYSSGSARGANGLYFARLINNSSYVVKYYNFTDFTNFFDFLPERAADKIQKKKEKQESKGKELNLDYQLLVHDLLLYEGQYLMVAEAYYATYRSEARPYTTIINGVPIVQTNYITVFDGWLYTHAIVAGFDMEGNMLWDNSIEMGDVKSFDLEERVSVNVDYGQVKLAYGTNNDIVTKAIYKNQVIGEKGRSLIQTGSSDDVIKSSALSNVRYWYDKYFLVYGYQKIKNESEDTKRKRTVFYFNKLAIQ